MKDSVRGDQSVQICSLCLSGGLIVCTCAGTRSFKTLCGGSFVALAGIHSVRLHAPLPPAGTNRQVPFRNLARPRASGPSCKCACLEAARKGACSRFAVPAGCLHRLPRQGACCVNCMAWIAASVSRVWFNCMAWITTYIRATRTRTRTHDTHTQT